jgi:hypothetical protein
MGVYDYKSRKNDMHYHLTDDPLNQDDAINCIKEYSAIDRHNHNSNTLIILNEYNRGVGNENCKIQEKALFPLKTMRPLNK